MKKIGIMLSLVFLVVAVVGVQGCASSQQTTAGHSGQAYGDNYGYGEEGYFYSGSGTAEESEKKAVVTKEKAVKAAPPVKSGDETISIAYPTGNKSTSSLFIEKTYPRVVLLNEPYQYTLRVTNLTNLSLQNVSVSEVIPGGFQLDRAEPNYSKKVGQDVTWQLGTLNPNESRTLKLIGKAGSKADLPCCTSADYAVPALCANTSVVQPAIDVQIDAPASAILCDRIPLTIMVKNVGDSDLRNVEVMSDLPSGTLSSGKNMINMRVGSLGVGQSKEYTAYVEPQKTGVFSFQANAQGDGVSDKSNVKSTNVSQPKLAINARSSKGEIYIGRPVDFVVNVRNASGDAAASTVVKATISGNSSVQSASHNGRISGRSVSWDLGTLGANAAKDLSLTVVGTGAGQTEVEAEANAVCTDRVFAKADTGVKGIPALLLEVVDVADPVEVGAEETYVITVTNQGSAVATNIKIVAELDGMSYVADSGATKASAMGGTVSFAPVSRLEARQVAEWKLKTKGVKAGDLRSKFTMTSDELTSPVQETESTYVY